MTTKKQITKPRGKQGAKREVKLLVGIALVAVLLIVGVAWLANRPAEPATPNILIREDSPSLGPADAKVTVVEFLDPECESCRAAFPMVKQILSTYEGQVRLVVRYFPLHNNSVLAAKATEAAGEQGKYWEMQELLFQNQPTWGEQQTPQTALFVQYATALGLDVAAFTEVLNSDKYTDKIQRDLQDGQALGVGGTPTFFVNGQKVQNISSLPEVVSQAVEN
ncbi:MAG: thioredoxin domain-containing protein [Caldilineaceae bacterium]|nr:thioredoxin domain-containing protein [Caldilineaceae bacterium]